MIDYALQSRDKLQIALVEHLVLTSTAFLYALIFATVVTLILIYYPKMQQVSVYILSLLYAIPSFALLSLLIPVTGLGKTTAIVALTIYAQYTLVRSFTSGLNQIDPAIMEAAKGMGMTKWQQLTKIQVPLAIPSLFAGLRLTANSMIAMATIASTINAGGLGTILFDGLRTMSVPKLTWGILLTVLLSLLANVFFYLLEELVKPTQSSQ